MVKTIVFFIFLWVSIIAAVPVGLIALFVRLIGLRYHAARFLQRFGMYWARLVIRSIGCTLSVDGLEHIPLKGPVCFVGNHPGDFDIILMMAYIDRPFGFTAKKEALFFPLINIWVWMLGGVFIDRKHVGKARKAIQAGAERIRKGSSMIIFPEGTRSRGKGLLPFRAGAFKLATLADAPIIPVSIKGSEKVWESENKIQSASVSISFGRPVPSAGLSPDEKRRLPDKIRETIAETLNRL